MKKAIIAMLCLACCYSFANNEVLNFRKFGELRLDGIDGKSVDVGNLGANINILIYIRVKGCAALWKEKKYWNETAELYSKYPDIVKMALIVGGAEERGKLKKFAEKLNTSLPVYLDTEDKFLGKFGDLKIQPPVKMALDKDSNLIYLSWSTNYEKEQQAFKEDIRRLVLTFK